MDETDLLRQYGARTASTVDANVDVTARVLRTIRRGRESRMPEHIRPLIAVAAASWMTVLVTGFVVQGMWSELQDPLTSLLSPFVVSLQ